jgi:hypothetical protein
MEMNNIPLLDDEYREAFIYILDEIGSVKECSDNKSPWYPRKGTKLLEALGVYLRWHPEEEENFILNFPWPKPGEIPELPPNYLRPTEREKDKIKEFLRRHDKSEKDPLTEQIVFLAKELIQEIH